MGDSIIQATPEDKVVYTYTRSFRGGMSHAHEGEMIPEENPGAGNILFTIRTVTLRRTLPRLPGWFFRSL